MSFSQQRPRGVALAKDPSERGLRGPFLVQGGGKRRLAGIFDPFQGFDWCAVIQKVSCPDDGAGGDSRRGEPYENITHHSFNSGTDDRCRSVAHNACQRLGWGWRGGWGWGGVGLGLATAAVVGSALAASSYYGYGYPMVMGPALATPRTATSGL